MALAYHNPPTVGKTFAAYRPIVFEIIDNTAGFPLLIPVVYLDIYIDGVYYKSMSSTSPRTEVISGSAKRIWQFDIQDAFQEFLRSELPPLATAFLSVDPLAAKSFFVKFRPAYVILDVVVPDGPIPIQGNYDSPPVAGSGIQSSTYCAVNSTLQHEDLQDLLLHLAAFRVPGTVSASVDAYPLTHRPTDGSLQTGRDQFGFFPLLFPLNSVFGANNSANTVTLFMDWQEAGNPAVLFRNTAPVPLFTVYTAPFGLNIPVGLGNLDLVAWSGGSTPNASKIYRYRVYLREDSLNSIFWQSGWMDCSKKCSAARLHFLNEAGGFDFVNFQTKDESLKTLSSGYQKPLPKTGLKRSDYGDQRFGIVSNEKVIVSTVAYNETAQSWLAESLDSPRVYSEQLSQGDAYAEAISVKISDGEFSLLKSEERYEYPFSVEYFFSNQNIRQRG